MPDLDRFFYIVDQEVAGYNFDVSYYLGRGGSVHVLYTESNAIPNRDLPGSHASFSLMWLFKIIE